MATAEKHKLRSRKTHKAENQSRERYFGHCMMFQTGAKKRKEEWKKVKE